jgi:hypothetical protein
MTTSLTRPLKKTREGQNQLSGKKLLANLIGEK